MADHYNETILMMTDQYGEKTLLLLMCALCAAATVIGITVSVLLGRREAKIERIS